MSKFPLLLTFPAQKRDSGTLSKPQFDLTNRYLKLYKNDVIQMICAVPSFQNITSSNNSSTVASTAISITAGKYSSGTSLANAVQTELLTIASTYTCTYSSITEKFTVANTSIFTMTTTTKDLLQFMGFTTASYSGATSYTSDSVPLLYPIVVHLQSNLHDAVYRGHADRTVEILSYTPDNTIYSVLIDNITPVLTFSLHDMNLLTMYENTTLRYVWYEWRDSSNNVLVPTQDWVIQLYIKRC